MTTEKNDLYGKPEYLELMRTLMQRIAEIRKDWRSRFGEPGAKMNTPTLIYATYGWLSFVFWRPWQGLHSKRKSMAA